MSIQIIANIPARKIGKAAFPARTETFTADDQGHWSSADAGAMTQVDVIDICQRATNWPQIKAAHFPMHGFSS